MRFEEYHIVAVKRKTGERIEGTTRWDGLSSLYTVETPEGRKIVSVLDDIQVLDRKVEDGEGRRT